MPISQTIFGFYFDDYAWRWMLGVEAIPAAIYAFFVLGVPESPRWLALKKKDDESARTLLKQLNPRANIEELLTEIKKSATKVADAKFFSRKYSFLIVLAFLIAFFNQLSGINFVLYYAPRIFEQAGIAATEVLGASIPLGIVNLLFTMLGMYLIDRVGRKQLMYYGSFGYIISLSGA